MIPIEKQVCSLEQSKQLKALGLTDGAHHSWVEATKISYCTCEDFLFLTERLGDSVFQGSDPQTERDANTYPAYNVSELGAMLSELFDREDSNTGELIQPIAMKYGASLSVTFNPLFLADVLIHRLQTGLITAENCNSKLNG